MPEIVEKVVVVVGSSEAGEFTSSLYVIDFSNAPGEVPPPVAVSVSGGCVVDCSEKLAAVGNCTGNGSVTIYDISTPAAPRSVGSTPTLSSAVGASGNTVALAGIGSISFYGGYVLAGEAGNAIVDVNNQEVKWWGRVALIDINNLANPKVYDTALNTVTGVAIFGQYAVISGLVGTSAALQVASLVESPLSLSLGPEKLFGPPGGVQSVDGPPVIVKCDFDGTNAVFSDGVYQYSCRISNGKPPTAMIPADPAVGTSSVTIAESGGAGQIASVGASPGVDLAGVTLFEHVFSIGEATKFSRSITGASTQLAAAGFTADGEYAVAYCSTPPPPSQPTWTQQGPSASVVFPSASPNYTLGIATFYANIPFPPPRPIRL